MRKQVLSLLASGLLFALAGTANAAQPLSDVQMDGVSAGGVAIANAGALSLGEVSADTITQTSTNVDAVHYFAIGQAYSQALAAGGFLFQAGAVSHVDTSASLP